MNERERWRRSVWGTVAAIVAGTGATAIAVAMESREAIVLALTLAVVLPVALVGWVIRDRRRSGTLVPPHLQGLEPEQRRIVSAIVQSGVAAPDPALAPVVSAHARMQQRIHLLWLASAAIGLSMRIASLPTSEGVDRVIDLVGTVFFLFMAAAAIRLILRARRAVAAIRGG